MVYERYIKKGEKIYGPYKYKSKKKNGKVISEYIGPKRTVKKKSKNIWLAVTLLVLLVAFGFFRLNFFPTGNVVSNSIQTNYLQGQNLNGTINFSLNKGEFIPSQTKVYINYSGKEYQFFLKNLVNKNLSTGNYYLKGKNLSGSGKGFGFPGNKLIYPKVNFTINILSSTASAPSQTSQPQQTTNVINKTTAPTMDNTTATPPRTSNVSETTPITNTTQTQPAQTSPTSTENPSITTSPVTTTQPTATGTKANATNSLTVTTQTGTTSTSTTTSSTKTTLSTQTATTDLASKTTSPLTGDIISNFNQAVSASVSKDKPYSYNISGVKDYQIIAPSYVNYTIKNGIITFTTNYNQTVEGFGPDYYQRSNNSLSIDLSNLNLAAQTGKLSINFIYNNESLGSVTKQTQIFETQAKLINTTTLNKLNQTEVNKSIKTLNNTVTNQTLIVQGVKQLINTTQYGAVVGFPVKWKTKVVLNNSKTNVSLNLPPEAENIVVYKGNQTGNLSTAKFNTTSEQKNKTTVGKIRNVITGFVVGVSKKPSNITVDINNENSTSYEVEYQTPAPVSFEKNTTTGKKVTISSTFHYKNILAYSKLNNPTPIDQIQLYHDLNGTKIPSSFTAYDSQGDIISGQATKVDLGSTGNNGSVIYGNASNTTQNFSISLIANKTQPTASPKLASFITWVVPHLSNQTYEVVINISKAEYLDANKNPLKDVYQFVKTKDKLNWTVDNNEYLRVTFDTALKNNRDITIWAKGTNNSGINIYKAGTNELVTSFQPINNYGMYKAHLYEMNGSANSFDLRVNGGSVTFDYVVDPSLWSDTFDTNTMAYYSGLDSYVNSWGISGGDMSFSDWHPSAIKYNGEDFSGGYDILVNLEASSVYSGLAYCGSGSDYNVVVVNVQDGRVSWWDQTLANGLGGQNPYYDWDPSLTETQGGQYWIRVEVDGTGQKMKVWQGNLGDEPGTWTATWAQTCSGSRWAGMFSKGNPPPTYFHSFEVDTIPDTTPPTITSAPDITVFDNQAISQQFSATDNVGVTYWSVNDTKFKISSTGLFQNNTVLPKVGGVFPVLVRAYDNAGNHADKTVVITVKKSDTTPPTVDVSPVSGQYLEYKTDRVNTWFNATDQNPVTFSVNHIDFQILGTNNGLLTNKTILPLGVYTLIITAEDDYANSIQVPYTLTVEDTIPPTIISVPNISTLDNESIGVQFTATDKDEVSTWTVNDTKFKISSTGYFTNNTVLPKFGGNFVINVSAQDPSGNIASKIINVQVSKSDTTAPIISSPESSTLEFKTQSLSTQFSATDTSGLGNWFINDSRFAINPTNGILTNNTILSVGTYAINVSVNDTYSNTASTTYQVTVEDTTAPTISSPSNSILEFTTDPLSVQFNATDYSTLGTWSVNDSRFIINPTNGILTNNTILPVGTYAIGVSINDTYGNKRNYSYQVMIQDTTSPIISSPENLTLEFKTQPLSTQFSATDTSGLGNWFINDSRFAINPTTGVLTNNTILPVGTYAINVSVNDTYSNTASTTYQVTVEDTTAPTISPPANSTLQYHVTPLSVKFSANDYSTLGTWSVNNTNFVINNGGILTNASLLPIGTYYLNVKVDDIYGNNGSAIYKVIIHDTISPTITTTGSTTEEYVYNETKIQFNATDYSSLQGWTVSDTTHFSMNPNTGLLINKTTLAVGSYLLTVGVNDSSQNHRSETYTVIVQDTTSPQMTLSNFTVYDYEKIAYQFSAFDYSGISQWTINDTRFSINNTGYFQNATGFPKSGGIYPILVRAFDTLGNYNSKVIRVNVIKSDTTAPIISSPENSILEFKTQSLSTQFSATDTSGLGNWFINDSKFIINPTTGILTNTTILAVGTYAINVSVNDTYSNTASTTYQVTVEDTTAPIISSPSNSILEFTTDLLSVQFNATDYSTLGTWSVNNSNFAINPTNGILTNNTILPVGTYTINVSVNDTYSNTASTTYQVTVEDTTAPTISSPENSTLEFKTDPLSVQFNATDYSTLGTWSVNDSNFAINPTTGILVNNTILPVGTYTIEVSINDTYGNKRTYSYQVTVEDTTAPTISPPANSILEFTTDPLSVQFNATDYSTLGTWSVNDSRFIINPTNGILVNNTILPVGTYAIGVSINDTYGNKRIYLYSVNVQDTINPIINLTAPLNNSIVSIGSSGIKINLTAQDYSGINTCVYNIDNSTNRTMTKVNLTFFNSVYTPLSPQNHALSVYCEDAQGNWDSTSANFFVNVLTNMTITSSSKQNINTPMNVYGNLTSLEGITLSNTYYLLAINGTYIFTNTTNDTTFTSGTNNGTSSTNGLSLAYSGDYQDITYSDDFSTNKYLVDSYSSYSPGYENSKRVLFSWNTMPSSTGNITYKFDSPTEFKNAQVTFTTGPAEVSGGTTSIYYSFDYKNWILLYSTSVSETKTVLVPVDTNKTFYIMFTSDTHGFTNENPLENFTIDYSNYEYSPFGTYTSAPINYTNSSYVYLNWQKSNNLTNVSFKVRQSNDGINWNNWSNSYNSSPANITGFGKKYLQYQAILSTNNLTQTPQINSVAISTFNQKTDASGFYNYTFNTPTTNIGNLSVSITPSSKSAGIIGLGQTYTQIVAPTHINYATNKNYSNGSKYTIFSDFVRTDTNKSVLGNFQVRISNSTFSSVKTCTNSVGCNASWYIPQDLSYGNYTIGINGSNGIAYGPSNLSFTDYLESATTTGTIYAPSVNVSDFSVGQDYHLKLNTTITNTGEASMRNIHIYDYAPARSSGVRSVVPDNSCGTLAPKQSCNITFNVTIDGWTTAGKENPQFISWRANWTDNNNGSTGGQTYIDYTGMKIILIGRKAVTTNITNYASKTQEGQSNSSNFNVISSGTVPIYNVSLNFIQGNTSANTFTLPSSWINFSPQNVSSIAAGYIAPINLTVSVPLGQNPGNYTGIINISAAETNSTYLPINIEVPVNTTWSFEPSQNFLYNKSFSINTPEEFANYTFYNNGNINLTFSLSYSPFGETDYTGFGTNLFQENYLVFGEYRNPSSFTITKGGNRTISLYQKGWPSALIGIGVKTSIYSSQAAVSNASVKSQFEIKEQPPEATNLWISQFGQNNKTLEQNSPINLKLKVTDDVSLNVSSLVLNLTTPTGKQVLFPVPLNSTLGEFTKLNGNFVALNYTENFTPTESGNYQATFMVKDHMGQSAKSQSYNFNVVGTTQENLLNNATLMNITKVNRDNSQNFTLNYTATNTGNVTAYNTQLTFDTNPNIKVSNHNLGNISSGNSINYVPQILVDKLTPPGTYNLYATLSWKNPSGTTSTKQNIIPVVVSKNESFSIAPTFSSLTMNPSNSNSTKVILTNLGNTQLTGTNLTCYTASVCNNFNIAFNNSNFNMPTNDSSTIEITAQNSNLEAQNYTAIIGIITSGGTKNFTLNLNVPVITNWTLSNYTINLTRGINSNGAVGVVNITNLGNTNLTFNIESYNSSIVSSNANSITIQKGTVYPLSLNYTAPPIQNLYITKVGVVPMFNSNAQNITVNLLATSMNMSIISPNNISKVTGILAGGIIPIVVNATYGNQEISSVNSWSAKVNKTNCADVTSKLNNSTKLWNINCTAPNLKDASTYDLTVIIDSSKYGIITKESPNSIIYKDTTPPKIVIERNDIKVSKNISLVANITDNVAVKSAWFNMNYPNGTIYSGKLNYSNGLYVFSNLTLNYPGLYHVNYTANDTSGNENTTSGFFEVDKRYNWSTSFTYANSTPQTGLNIQFLEPNTNNVLINTTTDVLGKVNVSVNSMPYDAKISFGKNNFKIKDLNFENDSVKNNLSLNFYTMDGDPINGEVVSYRPYVGIASNSTGIQSNPTQVEFHYSGYPYTLASKLSVIKCHDWNYSGEFCNGNWVTLNSTRDISAKTITADSTGSSAYFLAENTCGNGACELNFGETATTCQADCKPSSSGTTIITSGGSGGGGSSGASLSTSDISKIQSLADSLSNIGGVQLDTQSIYKEMYAGQTNTVNIQFKNTVSQATKVTLNASGETSNFTFFSKSQFTINPGETKQSLIKIVIPKFTAPGEYSGQINFQSGTQSSSIPVTINVLPAQGELLDVKIQPLTQSVAPGGVLRYQTDISNLGKTNKVDVSFDVQLISINTGEILTRSEETFAVEKTKTAIMNMTVPKYVPVGNYMVKAIASYANKGINGGMQATSIAHIKVQYHFFERSIFGISMKWIFIGAGVIVLFILIFIYIKWMEMKRRRFKTKVELNKLPKGTKHSIYVGSVAEYGNRAFVDLEKLKTHILIAGQTGSGKTIAAQDLVEGALDKQKGVIVFDPTAQWTGFLRKCEDKKMLSRYTYFDMKTKEAKAFKGSIKVIKDPYELIDIKKYMNRPGELTVFDLSNLQPKEIDIVVASTVEQIFQSIPEESQDLKTLIVYDEVHRLLPKFGGSGKGFIQLERGAREFRKWGIGLLLISQVLSDFVGEIKANIGTEIQMGTKYGGDLDRIGMKYGEDILKSVVKEPTGTGMIVNAEYNSGRPYFVAFRPILHSTQRLTKQTLDKYSKYFNKLEDLAFQIDKLKELGQDVIDLELELKFSRDKMSEGSFQMVDMYLETLEPKIKTAWRKAHKAPLHLVKKKLSQKDVLEGIKQAKKDRENYIKKNPEANTSFKEELLAIKESLKDKKAGAKKDAIEKRFSTLNKNISKIKGKAKPEQSKAFRKEIEDLNKEVDKL